MQKHFRNYVPLVRTVGAQFIVHSLSTGIHPDDIWLLAFTLNGQHYLNVSLPFGSASSCLIFEKVSTTLQYIVQNETAAEWMSHFLDDYIMLDKSTQSVAQLMESFVRIMNEIGMPISHEKTVGPTSVIEYLGLVLNLLRQLIMIPEKKRSACLAQINEILRIHHERAKVTVKRIQKLAGKLNFICQALPAGRPFIQSLYKLTRSTKVGKPVMQHHHRRLSVEVVADLCMFRSFLMESALEKEKTVPFLRRLGIYSTDIQLFADAAGASQRAVACVFKTSWCQGFWSETTIFNFGFRPNIALLELLAIVMAVEVWAPELTGKTLILRSDNKAACDMINGSKAEIPACMQLIRHLAKTSLHFQLLIQSQHIEGLKNVQSDLLSRDRKEEFRRRFPEASVLPTPLPSSLWPPRWTPKEMLKPKDFIKWKRTPLGRQLTKQVSRVAAESAEFNAPKVKRRSNQKRQKKAKRQNTIPSM